MFLSPLAWDMPLQLVNQRCAQFVQYCYEQSIPFGLAKHAVLALQQAQPAWRSHLQRPWNALKSWRLKKPGRHR
eukprot:8334057-Karenia_brevis.AAC.1